MSQDDDFALAFLEALDEVETPANWIGWGLYLVFYGFVIYLLLANK